MKCTTLKLAVFCAALMMPAAGWPQQMVHQSPVMSVPDEDEEEEYAPDKPFSGELILEYSHNNDDTEDSSETDYTATLEASYFFNENFAIQGTLLGSSVRGDGAFPNDYDFYFEELYLSAEFGRFGVFGGKFNPTFGFGFDEPEDDFFNIGYFGDYELDERLGVGVTYTFEDSHGSEHTLGASIFRLDTSLLAKSFFRGERLATRADGGLSNTGGLDSYNIWLEGEDAFGAEDMLYNISFRSQKGGLPGEATETGYVVSASKLFELENGNELEVFTELVSLNNSLEDGVSFNQDSLSATAAYYFGDDWVASLGGGVQEVRNSSDTSEIENGRNHFATASIGKSFAENLFAELNYEHERIDGVSLNAAGISLFYGIFELAYTRERTDGEYTNSAGLSVYYSIEF